MEKAVATLIKLAIITALMTGPGEALKQLVFKSKQDAKGAMQAGMSYGKWNRTLLRGK